VSSAYSSSFLICTTKGCNCLRISKQPGLAVLKALAKSALEVVSFGAEWLPVCHAKPELVAERVLPAQVQDDGYRSQVAQVERERVL
jgi:hypothetical protein